MSAGEYLLTSYLTESLTNFLTKSLAYLEVDAALVAAPAQPERGRLRAQRVEPRLVGCMAHCARDDKRRSRRRGSFGCPPLEQQGEGLARCRAGLRLGLRLGLGLGLGLRLGLRVGLRAVREWRERGVRPAAAERGPSRGGTAPRRARAAPRAAAAAAPAAWLYSTYYAACLHLRWQRGYTYYGSACSVAVSHGGKTTTTAPRHSERRCAAVHEPLAITVCE